MKSEQGRNYTNLLKIWQVNKEDTIIDPSFLTYTVTWLHLQNRGGLFEVHDDVFRFFYHGKGVWDSLTKAEFKINEQYQCIANNAGTTPSK